MDPFQALQIKYKRLKTQVDKEVADNYDRLISRIDQLELENRQLKQDLKTKSIWALFKRKYLC